MPFQIIRNDLTTMTADAIVNPTNEHLEGGGGLDRAIQLAGGKRLQQKCKEIGTCKVGDVVVTKGYKLPCKYVIHTAGPIWQGGDHHEQELLESCLMRALDAAKKHRCKSIALPLISSGTYGYPKEQVMKITMSVMTRFLLENEMDITLVVFDQTSFQISEKLFTDVQEYIDQNYAELHYRPGSRRNYQRDVEFVELSAAPLSGAASLDEMLKHLDESFSQMLMRKIDEAGMKDSECYKKANISRKLFSKIRSNVHYKPSKQTVLAFAIALELSLDETKDMLEKAGYALSHANKADVIIEYFILNHQYNIFEINETLFAFDQQIFG